MKAKKYTKGNFYHYTARFSVSEGNFAYAENMYIDPDGKGDAFESIPGCRRLYAFKGRINGIFKHKDHILVHAGEELYRFTESERDGLESLTPIIRLNDGESLGIFADDGFLISDGEKTVFISPSGEASVIDEERSALLKEKLDLAKNEGKSISLADGSLSLCQDGLINERGELISESVNMQLLPDPQRASLCLWRGYVTLLCGDRILLRQNRSDDPCWFTVRGVGAYKDDSTIYRYSSDAPDGFLTHPHTDGVAEGEIMSVGSEDGRLIFYTEEDGVRFTVYPTEERVGGIFYPATHYLVSDKLLYFGTGGGDLCVFNNDKRGVPPSRIRNAHGFDPEDYTKSFGDLIHPDFYSFIGHRVRYLLVSESEDFGSISERKINLKGTFTVKYRSYPRSEFNVEVISNDGTEQETFTVMGSGSDFADMDFSDFCPGLSSKEIQRLPEKNPVFTSKQIVISGEKYCSPIGIISLEYGAKSRR